MKPLTERQNEALQAIARFWKMGRAPTTGELLYDLHSGNRKRLVRLASSATR